MCAWVRACVCACVHARVCAFVQADGHACGRARGRACVRALVCVRLVHTWSKSDIFTNSLFCKTITDLYTRSGNSSGCARALTHVCAC
jgi:hypothetical protein